MTNDKIKQAVYAHYFLKLKYTKEMLPSDSSIAKHIAGSRGRVNQIIDIINIVKREDES